MDLCCGGLYVYALKVVKASVIVILLLWSIIPFQKAFTDLFTQLCVQCFISSQAIFWCFYYHLQWSEWFIELYRHWCITNGHNPNRADRNKWKRCFLENQKGSRYMQRVSLTVTLVVRVCITVKKLMGSSIPICHRPIKLSVHTHAQPKWSDDTASSLLDKNKVSTINRLYIGHQFVINMLWALRRIART